MEKKHIILIDDDKDEFDFLQEALARIPEHFDCRYARNADEAIKAMHDEPTDYILVDMNMPMINGLESVAKLRSDHDAVSVPIFIYTTSHDIVLRINAAKIGVAGCIKKPTTTSALSVMMKKLYESGNPGTERIGL